MSCHPLVLETVKGERQVPLVETESCFDSLQAEQRTERGVTGVSGTAKVSQRPTGGTQYVGRAQQDRA